MPLFKKRPITVEARQFSGKNYIDLRNWMMKYDCPVYASEDQIVIETLEGEMTASIGDWIIKGVRDEFYPCKPDVFEQTYIGGGDITAQTVAELIEVVDKHGQSVIETNGKLYLIIPEPDGW